MSAVARNYVYEVKVTKEAKAKEAVITKEFLEKCKQISRKYTMK